MLPPIESGVSGRRAYRVNQELCNGEQFDGESDAARDEVLGCLCLVPSFLLNIRGGAG